MSEFSIYNFRFTVGDIIYIKRAIQCDFQPSIKRGKYQLAEIFPHPKGLSKGLERYFYKFCKIKKDGTISESSGFIYNCLQWDKVSVGERVISQFREDVFIKELRDLLTKFQVSLSAELTCDSLWDDSSYPDIVIRSLNGKGEWLASSIEPWPYSYYPLQ